MMLETTMAKTDHDRQKKWLPLFKKLAALKLA